MTPVDLDRAVARATGEKPSTIRRLGFSLADPLVVAYDPEPIRRECRDGHLSRRSRATPKLPK